VVSFAKCELAMPLNKLTKAAIAALVIKTGSFCRLWRKSILTAHSTTMTVLSRFLVANQNQLPQIEKNC
jgi:hypothetical protein